MGTINTVRIINLNYNNNSIKVNDEVLHLNGQSTLVSLHNGGGKSVLIQMLTALFVHAKYRNTKERPFDGYFTTARPTIILIEWLLDNGCGKVMTGYMVRQNQENDEENPNSLDMISIISEYDDACINDIYSLPVVEKTKKSMVLKSYGECKSIFDGFKKDHTKKFFWYDMNYAAQSRQYFEKLKEYKIDYREWEHIIKKINEKESGLSDLFADCKNESDLVDKWFLDTVEKKLDPEKEKINNFRDIVGKYAKQYRDNESKIKQRDYIRLFKSHVLDDSERTSARKIAEQYRDFEIERGKQESRIAKFIQTLKEMEVSSKEGLERILRQIEEIKSEINQVIYEKYSYDIYKIEQDIISKLHEREQLSLERGSFEKSQKKIIRQLAVLECAKNYEDYCEELEAYREKEARIRRLQADNDDLLPKINELGGRLYNYFNRKLEGLRDKFNYIQNQKGQIQSTIDENEKIISSASEEMFKKKGELGALEAEIIAFGRREDDFNEKWGKSYSRNVLGRYEEGIFEIENDIAEKKKRELLERQKRTAALLSRLDKMRLDLAKERIDSERAKSGLEEKCCNFLKKIKSFEADIEERKNIAAFLQMVDVDIFDAEQIIVQLDRKIKESGAVIQQLRNEEKILSNEIQCLKSGVLTELPVEIAAEMEKLGIQVVFGMEWLMKNGHRLQDNVEIVRKNPFLPYALVLTENDVEKLKSCDVSFYHQSPIPIIKRKDLEAGNFSIENNTVSFDKISFYIKFDEILLESAEVEKIIRLKDEKLKKLDSQIEIKENEYNNYYLQKGILKNQKLDKKTYEAVINEEKCCSEELSGLAEKIEKNSLAASKNYEEIKENNRLLDELKEEVKELDRYRAEILRFEENYNEYLKALGRQKRISNDIENIRIKIEVAENSTRKCVEQDKILEAELHANDIEKREVSKDLPIYEIYRKTAADDEDISDEDVVKLKAEYNALTSKLSGEISELEADIKRIGKKIERLKRDIEKKSKECSISEKDYIDKSYNEDIEDTLKRQSDAIKEKILLINSKHSASEAKIAAISQQKKNMLQNMLKDTGMEEARSIEKISSFDFEAKNNILEHKESELRKDCEIIKNKISGYESILDGLGEYSDYIVGDDLKWDVNFCEMSKVELSEFASELKKTNNRINSDIQKSRNRLSDRIQEILNLENLAEEQYKKPLRGILRMLDRPQDILDQIDITVHALDTLMEKLAVDIEMVEKERDEIIDELMSYLEEINTGLGRIDSNSTINVQGKSLKMLQIKAPSWQEGKEIYTLRLKDYIGEVTKNVIRLLNGNENPDNELSSKINVNKLYDVVVGVGNVEIQIYKIEKQRTYPISWSDASKNSGGEGFLSTFVILSSLLYYIRRDESDIFAERNEGKVLLMDNPFAQTNAEHLLKPLMDIAKKNNTQLICFSGLGGESIYGRFDNIYVLNLIESRLNGGKQYLGVEHKRGAEPQELMSSQVEVYDQMRLF